LFSSNYGCLACPCSCTIIFRVMEHTDVFVCVCVSCLHTHMQPKLHRSAEKAVYVYTFQRTCILSICVMSSKLWCHSIRVQNFNVSAINRYAWLSRVNDLANSKSVRDQTTVDWLELTHGGRHCKDIKGNLGLSELCTQKHIKENCRYHINTCGRLPKVCLTWEHVTCFTPFPMVSNSSHDICNSVV